MKSSTIAAIFFTGGLCAVAAQDRVLALGPPALTTTNVSQIVSLLEFAAGKPLPDAERRAFASRLAEAWPQTPQASREAFVSMAALEPQIHGLPDAQKAELRQQLRAGLQQMMAPAPAATVASGSMPRELVGEWSSVRTSSIGYVNQSTGSWAPPSGDGSMYKFHADGTFEYYGMMQSSMYNCTMTITPSERGVIRISGNQMTFDSAGGTLASKDNCNGRFNYTKPIPANQKTYTWRVVRDEYGPKFCIVAPGVAESCAYRK